MGKLIWKASGLVGFLLLKAAWGEAAFRLVGSRAEGPSTATYKGARLCTCQVQLVQHRVQLTRVVTGFPRRSVLRVRHQAVPPRLVPVVAIPLVMVVVVVAVVPVARVVAVALLVGAVVLVAAVVIVVFAVPVVVAVVVAVAVAVVLRPVQGATAVVQLLLQLADLPLKELLQRVGVRQGCVPLLFGEGGETEGGWEAAWETLMLLLSLPASIKTPF